MYISITGLTPRNFWARLRFWRFAIPSFRQAQQAKGNTYCQVKKIGVYQCTLTAWNSREDMLNFLRSGTHLKAMKAFHAIAKGKTYGYESESIPTWEEAFELLERLGKNYD
jgi:hypothetical protein